MEWIPVFSLIVLVATIGTFIMSVSAYIMFKIKESRMRTASPRRAPRVEADVVGPEMRQAAPEGYTAPPGTARNAGQRLVPYTPRTFESKESKGQEPAAWR